MWLPRSDSKQQLLLYGFTRGIQGRSRTGAHAGHGFIALPRSGPYLEKESLGSAVNWTTCRKRRLSLSLGYRRKS